jgi:hypothetical protein
MASALEDILNQPTGARFYRADLHIHSCGASHDVRDETMTPTNIVWTAAREGLSLIAIADHNEIGNVEAAISAARDTGVLVIPAIELSTPQGHLLCYLPTLDGLRRLHGQLSIVDRNSQNSRCQQSLLECLNLVDNLGGFGVLAHVDVQSGFEVSGWPRALPCIDVQHRVPQGCWERPSLDAEARDGRGNSVTRSGREAHR